MNYEKFGIGVTFPVVLVLLAFIAISTGLGGLEIPVVIPETIPEPNTYYEWCYKMGIDCQG